MDLVARAALDVDGLVVGDGHDPMKKVQFASAAESVDLLSGSECHGVCSAVGWMRGTTGSEARRESLSQRGKSVLAAFGMSVKTQDGGTVTRLVTVMQRLLAVDGCPWDREQTFASLKKYAVEEAYEVCDAIDGLGPDGLTDVTAGKPTLGAGAPEVLALREELGDLLLQVVFQSAMAEARGWFGVDDVSAGICDKLERRHPHVFGTTTVSGSGEVLANWEKIKVTEKKDRGVLDGLPRALPALLYALRMGEKAGRVGFDWPDAQGPREKITEELTELDVAITSGDRQAIVDEFGDVLFSVVNLARKLGVDPEEALAGTNKRFAERFRSVEASAKAAGRAIDQHTLAELDAYWDKAKAAHRVRANDHGTAGTPPSPTGVAHPPKIPT